MLKVLKDNHPTLKKIANPILEVDDNVRRFAAKLRATMLLYKGIGLAAPQVGESIRLLVFDCTKYTYNALDQGFMINPEILDTSETTDTGEEGCLSFPGEYCVVTRFKEIRVKYLDLSGKEMIRFYKGLAARVIQHEIDHLNGITMKEKENEHS